jgi:hypothetical protein
MYIRQLSSLCATARRLYSRQLQLLAEMPMARLMQAWFNCGACSYINAVC